MRLFTPLSCDLEPDITKPTSRKIVVSSDLDSDMSAGLGSGEVINQGFCGPFLINSSCHDFEKVDKNVTRFFTPFSCDIEPDITKPAARNIFVLYELDPDPSAGIGSGGVIS